MMENYLNHLPYNKILDQSKLKAFSDNKINITEKLDRKSRKHCGKRRKCWLPAFSLFPTMFSKDYILRVFTIQDYEIKSKLKAFSDNKINITEKLDRKGRKHCGKRRKCRFPAFSLFPTMFSKDYILRVFTIQDYGIKSKINVKLVLRFHYFLGITMT